MCILQSLSNNWADDFPYNLHWAFLLLNAFNKTDKHFITEYQRREKAFYHWISKKWNGNQFHLMKPSWLLLLEELIGQAASVEGKDRMFGVGPCSFSNSPSYFQVWIDWIGPYFTTWCRAEMGPYICMGLSLKWCCSQTLNILPSSN